MDLYIFVYSGPGFPTIRYVFHCDWFGLLVRRWRGICGRRCGWCAVEVKVHKYQTY